MRLKMKIDHVDMALMYLGLDMNINILNIKHDLVWWWLYVLSSVHEKVNQHWGWVEQKRIYKHIYIYIFTLVDFLCRLKKLQSNQ